MKIGEDIRVDEVFEVPDVCGNGCCSKFKMRVLGQTLDISREQAKELLKRMQQPHPMYWDLDKYRYYPGESRVYLKLVLE